MMYPRLRGAHPVNHRHIVAGRCITSDTTRPAMSAVRRERAPWGLPQVCPNLQINNSFRHQTRAATNPQATPHP